jgi:hypothetical protein
MKSITLSKLSLLTVVMLLLSFNACQKENVQTIKSDTVDFVESLYPIKDIIKLDDGTKMRPDPGILQTRGELADIEDVPVVTSGVISRCGGTPEQCLTLYLEDTHRANSIKPGQRQGIYNGLSLDDLEGFNKYNCYRSTTRSYCGYTGKDKDHPLNISSDGNYRIQLSAKNADRNLDLFVYQHRVIDSRIDTILVASSILHAGKTETIHLTEKGYYTLVVDEKTPHSIGSDYFIAVSLNTPVKAIPIVKSNNDLLYQFQHVLPSSQNLTFSSWAFRVKVNGVWQSMGNFPITTTFSFLCNTCDYLVSPVYINQSTGLTEEGSATLIRP